MKEEYQSLFEKLLFALPDTAPPLKTYAIVDSARDSDFKEKVVLSVLPYASLWHETWFELEQERPLYLVELKRGSGLLRQLIKSRDKSIATYFISPCDIESLQAYYSRFTYVEIEEQPGEYEKAIFGFYDPNVLPNYIKTLYSEEKIEELFAGAAVWLAPSAVNGDGVYIAYRSKSGAIADINLRLKHFIEEESPMLNFDNVRVPAAKDLAGRAHPIVIDHRQMQSFDDIEKIKFIDTLMEEFKEEGYLSDSQETQIRQRAIQLFDEAKHINIRTQAGMYYYIFLALLLSKPVNKTSYFQALTGEESEDEKIALMKQRVDMILQQRREHHG